MSDMRIELSRHAEELMQQRGMRPSDLELVCEFGTKTAEGYFLCRKDKARAIAQLKCLISRLEHLENRLVVLQGNRVVTVYKASKKKQNRILSMG